MDQRAKDVTRLQTNKAMSALEGILLAIDQEDPLTISVRVNDVCDAMLAILNQLTGKKED